MYSLHRTSPPLIEPFTLVGAFPTIVSNTSRGCAKGEKEKRRILSRVLLLPILLSLSGTGALGQNTIIDEFRNSGTSSRGNFYGCDNATAITCMYGAGGLTIKSADTDMSFYTQFDNNGCQDVTGWEAQYVHVTYPGSSDFTIALQQNNLGCEQNEAPYPETWDVVYAADYASGGNIYIPISHFNIIKTRAVGLAFKAFRDPNTATTFSLVEITPTLPDGMTVPSKQATGPLLFSCTRPNSIAFGIDDGQPEFAAEVMKIIDDEGIKVTFFVVSNELETADGVLKGVYKNATANGHQIALHSYSHPKIESLAKITQMDFQIGRGYKTTKYILGVDSKYFRPPYGTDGALTRQRLEVLYPGTRIINWSIDIEDWLYGETDGGNIKKQTDAVKRDLAKGGNLFVAHFLYRSTVDQFRGFIQLAKATGKQIMRVDQCMEDPAAPPLPTARRSVHGKRD